MMYLAIIGNHFFVLINSLNKLFSFLPPPSLFLFKLNSALSRIFLSDIPKLGHSFKGDLTKLQRSYQNIEAFSRIESYIEVQREVYTINNIYFKKKKNLYFLFYFIFNIGY